MTDISHEPVKSPISAQVFKPWIYLQICDPSGSLFDSPPKPFKCNISVTESRVNDGDFVGEQSFPTA